MDPENPNLTHHVEAEAAVLHGLRAVAAHGDRIYLGEDTTPTIPERGSIRVIDGLRGGPIYAFRTTYDVPDAPVALPCTQTNCDWDPTAEDLPVDDIISLHVDDDGVFFTTFPSSGEPQLMRAQDNGAISPETIVGGEDATTYMCPGDQPDPCANHPDVILGRDFRIGATTHIARGPDGAFYVADESRDFVYRIARAVPPMYVSSWLNSEDGSEVYRFDEEGRHLQTRDSRTHELIWSFQYDEDGLLVGITDRFDNTTTITRDATGQATSIVSPDLQTTLLDYDGNGYLDTVTDPTGAVTGFSYTDRGLMTSMYDFDSESNVESQSIFGYDARGRLTDDDAVIAYQGSPEGTAEQELARLPTGEGIVEVQHTSATGLETLYHRERVGPSATDRLVTWPDGTQNAGYRSPDTDSVTYPDGTRVTAQYDVDLRLGANTRVPGKIDVFVPTIGNTTATTFGRSFTPHCGLFTEDCDPVADPGLQADEIVETMTRGGTWTETFRRTHIEGGNPVPATITSTTPLLRTSITVLNGDGDPATIIVGDRPPVILDYDDRGRLEVVSQTDGVDTRSTTILYDDDGFVESVTDSLNRTTSYLYDEVGRVERQTFPDSRFVLFSYDEDGNVTSVTPPSRPVHDFTHDSLDRTRTYDPPIVAGVTEPTTAYEYDADHRPVLITRPDDLTIDLDYDPITGKLELVTTPTGEYDYAYDATTGLLETVSDPDGGSLAYDYYGSLVASETLNGDVDGSVSWTYDNQLRVLEERVNGGQVVTRYYDQDGAPQTIGDLTVTTDPVNGELATTTIGSVTSSHDYNDFGEGMEWTYLYNGSTLVYDLALTRDEVGRIKTKIESRNGSQTTRCYEYDQAGRLTDVYDGADSEGCTGTLVEHYGYDANGNRNEVDNGSVDLVPSDFDIDEQDRLHDYGDVAFSYTENGEVESMEDASGTTNFAYDASGNLQSVDLPGGTTIEYVYDARDRRVGKKVGPKGAAVLVQGFLYGDQLEPVAELDGAGTVVSRFVYGTKVNVPDYMLRDGNTYRIISDHLGSVVAVANATSGAVVQEITYDSFGRVQSIFSQPGFDQPFRFAGGMLDQHTGWVRFGARDYQPETGRWSTKDPWGFGAGDSNLYRYVFNDPVNYVDPTGEDAWQVASDFAAGFGDTLTFNATKVIRESSDWTSGVVDYCSAAYSAGVYAEIGFEVFAMGLSGSLRALARRADRVLVRNAAEPFVRGLRQPGHTVHHVNPLFGHPFFRGIPAAKSLFPLGGLRASIHSGRWNLRALSPAAHKAAHQGLRANEKWAKYAVNPLMTYLRFETQF